MLGYTLSEWMNEQTNALNSRNNYSKYKGCTVDFLNKSPDSFMTHLSVYWGTGVYSTDPHCPSHLPIYHVQPSSNGGKEWWGARLPFGMVGSVHRQTGETHFCPMMYTPNDFSAIQICSSQKISLWVPEYALITNTFPHPLLTPHHSASSFFNLIIPCSHKN